MTLPRAHAAQPVSHWGVVKWAVELSGFDLQFAHTKTIKSKALVNVNVE